MNIQQSMSAQRTASLNLDTLIGCQAMDKDQSEQVNQGPQGALHE